VPESSLAGDSRKFRELLPSCGKVIALYTVRGGWSLALPRKRRAPAQWIQEEWHPRDPLDSVVVKLDTELYSAGGIEELQADAIRRAGQ
jgi:hypothetical protein